MGNPPIAHEHLGSGFVCFKYILDKSKTKCNTWTPCGFMMFMRSIMRATRFINQGVAPIDL